ncbi:sugar ABC transporter permease [Streptococcus parauberis]|nr:sugar ABC transporter permease [Streptococcus parauberis]
MTLSQSRFKNALLVALFVLPAFIPLFIFWVYPILRTFWLSFTDWNFMTPEYQFVQFSNYKSLLADSRFYEALKNTLVFTLGTLVPTILGGLTLAMLLQKKMAGSGLFKFILFSPWITPTVAISIVWTWIFEPKNGFANLILQALHLPALEWLKSSQTAMLAVVIVTVWKSLGYAMIFYLSALEKVPKDIYEASSLDGAKPLRQFIDMTLPSISPTTFFSDDHYHG